MLNKIALVFAPLSLAHCRRLSERHSRRPLCRKVSAPPITTVTARAEGVIQILLSTTSFRMPQNLVS